MRRQLCALTVGALVFATTAQAKTYDCELNHPLWLDRGGEAPSLKEINFPNLKGEIWRFKVEIKEGKRGELDLAEVRWPGNPIQIAGSYPVVPTAEGAIAFSAIGLRGCMFTDGACLTIVQIADQDAGQAKVSVLPSALWTHRTAHKSDPFVAVIDGACTWKDS